MVIRARNYDELREAHEKALQQVEPENEAKLGEPLRPAGNQPSQLGQGNLPSLDPFSEEAIEARIEAEQAEQQQKVDAGRITRREMGEHMRRLDHQITFDLEQALAREQAQKPSASHELKVGESPKENTPEPNLQGGEIELSDARQARIDRLIEGGSQEMNLDLGLEGPTRGRTLGDG